MKTLIRDLPLLLFMVFIFGLFGWLGIQAATTLEGKGARWVIEQIERVGTR